VNLALFGAQKVVGIDVLKSDEGAPYAGALRLVDEIRDTMTQRIDLDREMGVNPLPFPQFDNAIEDRLPILVAGKIVVGDEEPVDALTPIFSQKSARCRVTFCAQ
jgi:hypothetical protein